jgi:DNA-3-methyladenine glycosylase
MKPKKLKRAFYERDTLMVARELLGMYLVHNSKEGTSVGIIVEAEAYIGPNDAASHAYRGRTSRNEVMFGPGGYAYVYFIYGMHYCFNIVTQKADFPAAVLVRALEPVEGIDLMARRRGIPQITGKTQINLTNGPAKLCEAMGIDKSVNGADLCGNELFITTPEKPASFKIITTPRINIDYAGEAIEYPWRFLAKGNRFVSRK